MWSSSSKLSCYSYYLFVCHAQTNTLDLQRVYNEHFCQLWKAHWQVFRNLNDSEKEHIFLKNRKLVKHPLLKSTQPGYCTVGILQCTICILECQQYWNFTVFSYPSTVIYQPTVDTHDKNRIWNISAGHGLEFWPH